MTIKKQKTLGEFLKETEKKFLQAKLHFGHGTDNAWDEAVNLAMFVLDLPPDVEKSVEKRILSSEEEKKLNDLRDRRIKERRPLPYLSHQAWFAGEKYYVDERVIIPRSPFAELILNHFQPWLGSRYPKKILDLCTGSGCMAIATAHLFPDSRIDALDLSEDALAVARKNIELHHCEAQVNLFQSDLFKACKGKRYDLIISNPPYVGSEEYQSLNPEYQWEPRMALEAEDRGLSIVKRILKEAPEYLEARGLLFVELGNSAETLMEEFPEIPFTWLEFERGGSGLFMIQKEDILKAEDSEK